MATGSSRKAPRGPAPSATETLNPLRARLARDQPCCGMIVSMPGVAMVQALAGAGFDWLFIDMEHGPIDIESAHAMIAASAGSRAAPIVRVPWNVHWLIKPVLDAGAMGVIVPMVRSVADARAAANAVRYPPAGERGFGPFYAPLRWGLTMESYADAADRDAMCILLIEHRDAVRHIKQIAAVAGVDVCLIAPFDLSMSYGYRDGPDHTEVQRAIAHAEQEILASGKVLGGLAFSAEAANALIARGYRMILCGFDIRLVSDAARALLDHIQRDG